MARAATIPGVDALVGCFAMPEKATYSLNQSITAIAS
jgi:hypothetical protein